MQEPQNGNGDNKKPDITVIVPTQAKESRDDFFKLCIRSVIYQSYPKEKIEVIVVSDNERVNDILDTTPRENVRVLIIDEKSLGGKLNCGIRNASSDVISFLEDDDEFEFTKIESIMKEFSKDKSLVYIHDNYTNINSKSVRINIPTQTSRIKTAAKLRWKKFDSENITKKEIGLLVRSGVTGNNSCISIRKGWAIQFVDMLNGLNYGVDTLFLFAALTSKVTIGVIGECLTKYRVYNSNTSNYMMIETGRDGGHETFENLIPVVTRIQELSNASNNKAIKLFGSIFYRETEFLFSITHYKMKRIDIVHSLASVVISAGLTNKILESSILYKGLLAIISQKRMASIVNNARGQGR
jgi:glycosyltransferase involved in cell wall biosynthesis